MSLLPRSRWPAALTVMPFLAATVALSVVPAPARSSAQQAPPAPPAPYALEASWPLPPRDFTVADVAVAADGSVAVADEAGNRVLFYGPDGSFTGQWAFPCDAYRPINPRLEVSPTGDRFLAAVSCQFPSSGMRNLVAQLGVDGGALGPPAIFSQPVGAIRDIASASDGQLVVMGDLRLVWMDPTTGQISRSEALGQARAGAVRVAALPAGAAALLFSDGHLERYDGNGVQVATGTLADSRLTLTDLVAEADGGTVGLVDTRGAIPAAQRTLLARFDQDLRLLAMEGPPGLMAVLPFEAPRGFGAQFLHRSAGGWVVATRSWVDEVHRLAPDGTGLPVTAASIGPRPYDPNVVAPPLLPRLSLAWVDGKPWLLDGRVMPPELLALSATGSRRLAAATVRAPYLDMAAAPDGGVWLSRPDGIDHWSAARGLETMDLPCACQDGGRIAALELGGLTSLLVTQPRQGRVQVVDAGLRAAAGSISLPDPAALWPADLAVTPGGEVLTADAATGEVQRWTPGGRLRGGWLETGPGAGPRRIAVADMAGGPDRAALLSADQRLVLRELPEGRWLGEIPLALPDPDGFAEDLTMAPDGRVFLSDSGAGRVHLFAPIPGALPTPGGAPSPTPTPSDRPCRIDRDKVVGPGRVVLGQTAAITLSLAADCGKPGRHVGADMVLVVEHTHDRRAQGNGSANEYLARVPDVAATLTQWMDLRRHRAGLATASGDDLVSLPLGTPPQQIVDRLRSLVLPGSTAPSLMDLMTNAETMIAGRRPDSLGVVVLITNAAALHAHSIRDQESATAALAVAKRLRADGVQLFAVLIPGTDRRTTTPESTWAWLTTITGSRQRVYEADGPAQIERLGNQIYSQIRTLAGTSLAGSLTIHDEMAPDIALLPGTADGSPLEGPDWLIWRRGLLPASGITLSYRIRPQKVGLLPTNRFAVADYTDVDGQRRSVAFPLPRIEVIAPSPTPTSTASPSPTGPPTSTPRPRPLYLPLLSLRHCLARSGLMDVALVLDSSQSMLETGRGGRSKLDAAREAVQVFLDLLLLPADRAAIVRFSGDAAVLQGLTGERALLEAGLRRLTVSSGTRIHLGLERARGLLAPPNPGRRSVILLLTDGRSDPDPASLAIAQARAAQADGIVVVAVGLGADIDRASLEQMASPGQFHLAPDAEDLAGVYRRLAAAMPCLP